MMTMTSDVSSRRRLYSTVQRSILLLLLLMMMMCPSVHCQTSIPNVGSCVSSQTTADSVTYLQDPTDVCRVYACRRGQFILPVSFRCPPDVYVLPGPASPCARCTGGVNNQLGHGVIVTTLPPGGLGSYYGDLTPPPGFVSAQSAVQILGGTRLLVSATLRQCLDACLMTSYCLAVDYDTTSRDCYVHGTASYCRDVITHTTSSHYKRVPCTSTTSVSNSALEVWSGYRASQQPTTGTGITSSPQCRNCRLVDCLARCYGNRTCGGVDYDLMTSSCYLLNATVACRSLTPNSAFLHVAAATCQRSLGGGSGAQRPSTGGAIYTNFVSIAYAGPTALPLNWFGYPGSRVVGGVIIAYSTTGDRCVALCQLYGSCYAVDFNSVDGTCWAHTSQDTKCAPPLPANYVYHAKKPPTCHYITGTSQPYPFPVTVGSSYF